MGLRGFYNNNKSILLNYLNYGIFDFLLVIIPIIIIPLFLDIFGKLGYGEIVLARVYALIAGVFIDFGYKNMGAKNIAKNKDSVLFFNSSFLIKVSAFVFTGFFYSLISFNFSSNPLLHICFYLINIQTILIPNFLFIGMGKFKDLSKIGFLVSISQILLFFSVLYQFQYLFLVPLVYFFSYVIGGIYSLIVLRKINNNYYRLISFSSVFVVWNENISFLKKNIVGIIKDKLSYLIIGYYSEKSMLFEYDLGMKFINLLSRPISIYSNVIIKKSVEMSKDVIFFYKNLKVIFFVSIVFWLILITSLPIVISFITDLSINLNIIYVLTISLVFLNLSSFTVSNGLLVFNKSKEIFNSSIIVALVFLTSVILLFQFINPLYSVVAATILSYFTEFIYLLWKTKKM
jgi:polysaccharide transporter, PST family